MILLLYKMRLTLDDISHFFSIMHNEKEAVFEPVAKYY